MMSALTGDIYAIDRDSTVRCWLTEDQAETDGAYRRVQAAQALLLALGIPSNSVTQARAVKAAQAAEAVYNLIVKIDHWFPTEMLNEMHLRMDAIDSRAKGMATHLLRAAQVPLSLPVVTIRPMHAMALTQPSDAFEQAMDDPDYPTYDPREHIVTQEGYHYGIHLEVRARSTTL